MVDKSAFGFDQNDVDRWDARQTGQALRPILAKIGRMNRTDATDIEMLRTQLQDDPDALSGLDHLSSIVKQPAGGSNR